VGKGALVFIEPLSQDLRRQRYKKGEYVTKAVSISDDMVKELEILIKDTWRSMNEIRFEKLVERDKKICANCDFDNICWG